MAFARSMFPSLWASGSFMDLGLEGCKLRGLGCRIVARFTYTSSEPQALL